MTSDNMEMGITGCCAMLKLQVNIGELDLTKSNKKLLHRFDSSDTIFVYR